MKKTAVPSQNLPISTVSTATSVGTSSERTGNNKYNKRKLSNQSETDLCISTNKDPQDCNSEADIQVAETLKELRNSTPDISENEVNSVLLENSKMIVHYLIYQVSSAKLFFFNFLTVLS